LARRGRSLGADLIRSAQRATRATALALAVGRVAVGAAIAVDPGAGAARHARARRHVTRSAIGTGRARARFSGKTGHPVALAEAVVHVAHRRSGALHRAAEALDAGLLIVVAAGRAELT